jgi:hypothetical protein
MQQQQKHKQKSKEKTTQTGISESSFLNKLLANVDTRLATEVVAFFNFYTEATTQSLSRMWEYGRRVEHLRQPEFSKTEGGAGRIAVSELLANSIGRSTSWLNKMAQLYRAYDSESKRRELLGMKLENGCPVSWKHLEQLLKLYPDKPTDSKAAFVAMQKEMISKSLTPTDLEQRVATHNALTGQGGSKNAGRPIRIPADFRGRVARLIRETDAILKSAREIYASPQYGFLASIREMSQPKVAKESEQLAHEVAAVRSRLREILDVTNDRILSELDQAQKYIQQCSTSHVESTGKSDAAELDAADEL